MPQRNPRNIIVLLLFAMLAIAGCTGNGTNGAGAAADGIDWEDSALVVVGPVETYFFNDEIDSLLMVVPQVLDFCREHEVWWVFYGAWERKAEAFAWQGDYDRAAEEADGMRRDAEHRGNDYGQAMAYYVLAQGYAMQNNYDEAIPHYKRAIDLYPEGENPSMLADIYSTYAEVLALKDDYERMDSLMPRWKRIIDRKPVTGTDAQQDDIAASWRVPYFTKLFMRDFNKGNLAAAAHDLDSADYYNGFSADIQWNTSVNLRYRSRLANAQGRHDEALALIDSALTIGCNMGPSLLAGNLKERIDALYGLGRYREAFDALRQQKTLGDSITQADNREQLNVLNKRFHVAELQLQNERTQRRFTIALAAVALLAVILVFYIVHTRNIRRKNRKLYEQIMQLQAVEETSHADIPTSDANPLFAAICHLMSSEHLYTNPDLNRSDLAQRLGTNDHYVSDAISDGTGGKTLQQFLNGYRLQHAIRLLTDTDDGIEQVAFASGFNSRQVFARVFRDKYEMSPSAFRRASHER